MRGLALFLLLLIAGTPFVMAQEIGIQNKLGIPPDSPLYFIQQLKEKVISFIEKDNPSWTMELAQRRLAEAYYLLNKNKTKEAEKHLNMSFKLMKKVEGDIINCMNRKDCLIILNKTQKQIKEQEKMIEQMRELTIKHRYKFANMEYMREEVKELMKENKVFYEELKEEALEEMMKVHEGKTKYGGDRNYTTMINPYQAG